MLIIEIKLRVNIFNKTPTNVKTTDKSRRKTMRKVEYKMTFYELNF